MSVYIKHYDEEGDSLTHYGVKGMKWHKHKKSKIRNAIDDVTGGDTAGYYDPYYHDRKGVKTYSIKGAIDYYDTSKYVGNKLGTRLHIRQNAARARLERSIGGRTPKTKRALTKVYEAAHVKSIDKKLANKGKSIIDRVFNKKNKSKNKGDRNKQNFIKEKKIKENFIKEKKIKENFIKEKKIKENFIKEKKIKEKRK